jgi:hypothetical protein
VIPEVEPDSSRAVVGFGRVGTTIAEQAAVAARRSHGIDLDPCALAALPAGHSPAVASSSRSAVVDDRDVPHESRAFAAAPLEILRPASTADLDGVVHFARLVLLAKTLPGRVGRLPPGLPAIDVPKLRSA